ncbi:hypothetical protein TREES_T100014956 [Tupaia chinensis]|uniref:Uncharacterized protein n=1 Tax=Tupaia chinensis TaxID=246437 RepID=L9KP69_TUPCH|nr:hypothetical protein TREES_T100014956 [Tupaia chinensis]
MCSYLSTRKSSPSLSSPAFQLTCERSDFGSSCHFVTAVLSSSHTVMCDPKSCDRAEKREVGGLRVIQALRAVMPRPFPTLCLRQSMPGAQLKRKDTLEPSLSTALTPRGNRAGLVHPLSSADTHSSVVAYALDVTDLTKRHGTASSLEQHSQPFCSRCPAWASSTSFHLTWALRGVQNCRPHPALQHQRLRWQDTKGVCEHVRVGSMSPLQAFRKLTGFPPAEDVLPKLGGRGGGGQPFMHHLHRQ